MSDCLFCREYRKKYDHLNNKPLEIILQNNSFWVKFDPNPVSPGHALIVSKEHVDNISNLIRNEPYDYINILRQTIELIDRKYHPEGYNLGSNIREAAGQTIFHLHIHVIPRYFGDVPNPRGGIRNIIPGKGDYKK